jgi:hypothetical protein
MHIWVIGFWGSFFGTVAPMLAGSVAAFVRSHERVVLTAALTSVVSALFAAAFLGCLPLSDPDHEARLLAHVAILAAAVLGRMLWAELGLLRQREAAWRARKQMAALGAAAVVAMARDMSRTAWSYLSRVTWHDLASGQIAELPATEGA